VEKTDHSSTPPVDFDTSLTRLNEAASWHYPPLLRWILPNALRDALRNLRSRLLTRQLPSNKEFEQSAEDALASSSLSIIVPVHDSPNVTARCLISLQKYAPQSEIILVDDASKLDETRQLLESFCRRNHWKLIRHSRALGHSGASLAGTKIATRPYICLLNSDTVVTPWCWRSIVYQFDNDPEIGVAGPSTSNSGNSQDTPLASQTRHFLNDSQICEYARRLLTDCSGANLKDLTWVSGFAFFIRRNIWEHLGGFDPNLPDYGNDVELCKRVVVLGYRVVWVRNSYIHHHAGMSYDKVIGRSGTDAHLQAAGNYIRGKHGPLK
jgi:GT2 family glycosyltransferase